MTAKILGWKYVDRLFQLGHTWQCAPAAIMVLLVASLLAACGGGGAAAPASEQSASTPTATIAVQAPATENDEEIDLPDIEAHDNFDKPCDDGVLTVAEVGTLDDWWVSTFDSQGSDAKNWQSDVQLVRAGVICWTGDQPELRTTFKSEIADEARDFPDGINMGGSFLAPIDASLVSFTKLHDSLLAAGFTDETIITGIDMSETDTLEGAELGLFYYHVGEYDPDLNGKNVIINPRDGSFEFAER
jgi:hypothetical protein